MLDKLYGDRFLWTLLALGALSILVYALNSYGISTWDPRARILGFTTYRVSSGSMEPTLVKDDFILVEAVSYVSEELTIGDVIVFRYPENRSVPFVFRVVGEAGDKVKIVEGTTYVKGAAPDETYVRLPQETTVLTNDGRD